MSELSQEEIRRRRLARLAALESSSSPSNSISPPITPISQSPMSTTQGQSPPVFESQGSSLENKFFASPNSRTQELKKDDNIGAIAEKDKSTIEGVFKEPSKPIDIQIPSSSKQRSRAPPVRSDSETSSIHMEVDEVSGCADKMGGNTDIDSGFENMEVDESDLQKKDLHRQRTTSSSTELTLEQLQETVARILQSSFFKSSPSRVFLPQTAEYVKENPNLTIRDLTSTCIMEMLTLIGKGNNPFKNIIPQNQDITDTYSLHSGSVSPVPSSPSTSDMQCPVPALIIKDKVEDETPGTLAINYLTESYNRVAQEERNFPKRSSIPPLSDVLTEVRAQIIQYTALVVQGRVIPGIEEEHGKSPLLTPIVNQTIPRGFLIELVTRTYSNEDVFSGVFSPILQGLFNMMRNACIVEDEHRLPLQALFELADIRCNNRPICTLITKQFQFPVSEPLTNAGGRELTFLSFMGPFLDISIFAEDEPKVAEKLFSGNSANDNTLKQGLQLELEHTRNLLHRIFHFILANQDSRAICLEYLAQVLKYNEKRAQLAMEERLLAGDGFMLNLLSVLQSLSLKIKFNKMDLMYPFHPEALIQIQNDTRLKFSSQEVGDWLEEFVRSNGP